MSKSLFSAGIAILLFAFLVYVFLFIYSRIHFLSAEIGSAVSSVVALEEKGKEFEVSKSNLEKQGENISILESAFFSESTFVELLSVFESVGKKAGVWLKVKGAKLPESEGSAEVSFELSGNFNSIARFLVLLDNIRYSGQFNKFSLFVEEEKSDILTAQVDYLIFNYK